MTTLRQAIEDRLARYRKLRARPDMLKGKRENLNGSIEELEWVREQLLASEPGLTPPQPKQLSLV